MLRMYYMLRWIGFCVHMYKAMQEMQLLASFTQFLPMAFRQATTYLKTSSCNVEWPRVLLRQFIRARGSDVDVSEERNGRHR